MKVCDYCLQAIKNREGNQRALTIYVDKDDEMESKCEWCEECYFDTLYEI